jgi:hypothetical protein
LSSLQVAATDQYPTPSILRGSFIPRSQVDERMSFVNRLTSKESVK